MKRYKMKAEQLAKKILADKQFTGRLAHKNCRIFRHYCWMNKPPDDCRDCRHYNAFAELANR